MTEHHYHCVRCGKFVSKYDETTEDPGDRPICKRCEKALKRRMDGKGEKGD